MKFQNVTRAPPTLSASQPPTGRISAPRKGPIQANSSGLTPGNWLLISSGKPAEKPMNEPKVPRYSQHMIQLCLRLKITACSENEAFASAMSFIIRKASSADTTMGITQTNAAFCSQICFIMPFGICTVVASPPNQPKMPTEITSGTMN